MNQGYKISPRLPGMARTFLLVCLSSSIGMMIACGGGPPTNSPSALLTPVGAPVAITITPSTPFLPLGGTRQLLAMGTYSNGAQQDVTPQVTWSSSSTSVGGVVSSVSLSPSGLASGLSLGGSVVTAAMGSVTGALQLIVNTNGYSSSTMAAMVVPVKGKTVDVAYLPKSLNQVQGSYRVEEVNLDADQFTSVLPVPAALVASIAMPAGFIPNVAVADQTGLRVAVISYNSPNVQIIDASNDLTLDPLSNTVTATYSAPISKKVTFGGITCMICAAVVNPQTEQLLLSTSQGYYSMDLTTGVFTQLSFTPQSYPAPSFTLNPMPATSFGSSTAADPFIISPTFGQDPSHSAEVQILDLANDTLTTNLNLGLAAPLASAFDYLGQSGIVLDSSTNNQTFADFSDPQNLTLSTVAAPVTSCSGSALLGMASLGIPACVYPSGSQSSCSSSPTLFLSQVSGGCIGFEQWLPGGAAQTPASIPYGYGSLPPTPDGQPFVNGSDPNAIATFSSVIDKNNYGLLEDSNQKWMFKINGSAILSDASISSSTPLPTGESLQAYLIADQPVQGHTAVLSLPIPDTIAVLSSSAINFGNVPVASLGISVAVTLTNIDASQLPTSFLNVSQIGFEGGNSGDFTETDTCSNMLPPQSSCTITVIFAPKGTGVRSATLTVTDDGGASPQTIVLSGMGT